MAAREDTWRKWLRGLLYNEDDTEIRKLELRQVQSDDGSTQTIQNWRLDQLSELDTVITTALEACEQDSEGFQSIGKYCFFAYLKDGTSLRSPIVVFSGGGSKLDAVNGSENVSTKGLLAQAYRHNEAIMRMSVGGTEQVIQALTHENARLSDQLADLENKRMEAIVAKESALEEGHIRQLEMRQLEESDKLKQEAFSVFKDTIIPLVASKLLNGKGEKLTDDQLSMLTSKLVNSITNEQLGQLGAIFKNEQQILIAEIMTASKEKEAKNKGETQNG